jgi:predicted metalloendopeptidase
MRTISLVLLSFLVAALLVAAGAPRSGIDVTGMDTSCKPCQDFWQYANGNWVAKNPIPARYPAWGTMSVLAESNRERLHAILDHAAADKSAPAGSNERKIGDFYSSCMATGEIDQRGDEPVRPQLDRISKISSVKDLGNAIVQLQEQGRIGPVGIVAMPDFKNSKEMIANVSAGALSLPDRDYYFKDDPKSRQIREEFVKHASRMMQLLGDKPDQADGEARMILAFETSFAEVTPTNVQRRDPYSRYHKMPFQQMSALTPNFDWKPLFAEFHVDAPTAVNVTEPKLLERLNTQLTASPLEDWKNWLRWRVVNAAAPLLSKPFFDEDFAFNSTVLNGVKEQLPRWQTCTNTIDRSMGEALGQVFVQKYFPPEAKRRMSELVENLRATLREQLDSADWIASETKKNAVAKLGAFASKIGYPERWRDYSGLKIIPDSYYENARAAAHFNQLYQLAKIGKPVDRNDWTMTPPTVNAYYNPTFNEIVFPAGILQPPMFDLALDDAANYGAIGAVIGHEMGHGFDDQGSKFDAEGNLKNWWTDEDRKKFEQRTGCVIDEFNTLEVGDGLHHNGKLVVGEAMGDLGGLTLAYKAYHWSLQGKEAPVLDGFAGDQRFFLAFARVWAGTYRPEAARLRLNTDPHPLPRFRANGTLQNMPEFRKAFHCQAGDAMVRPPEKECRLW